MVARKSSARGLSRRRARPGRAVGLRHRADVVTVADGSADGSDHGWDRLEVGFGRLDAMVSEVLGYGDDLVVDSPEDLRDAVVERLEAVLATTEPAPTPGSVG